jgi:hypothetical protein
MWPFRKKSPQERLEQMRVDLAGAIARRDALSKLLGQRDQFPARFADELANLSQYIGEMGECIKQAELEIGAPND